MTLQIPIRNDLQSFTESIDLDGVVYILEFDYNLRMDRWHMTILDANGNVILAGMALECSMPAASFHQVDGQPAGTFIMIDETGQDQEPDLENFGDTAKLIYIEAASG